MEFDVVHAVVVNDIGSGSGACEVDDSTVATIAACVVESVTIAAGVVADVMDFGSGSDAASGA